MEIWRGWSCCGEELVVLLLLVAAMVEGQGRRFCGGAVRRELCLCSARLLLLQLRGKRSGWEGKEIGCSYGGLRSLKAEGEDRCCWFEGRRPGCGRRRRKALGIGEWAEGNGGAGFWGKNGGTAGEKADWGGGQFFSAEREKEVSTGWGAAAEMKKEGGNSWEGELGRLSRREKTEREEEKWKPPGGGRRLLLEKKKNKFCRVRWVRFF
jgi:hypothetical protein